MIDNIYIIHPQQRIVDAWEARILEKANKYHAVLKDESPNNNNNMNEDAAKQLNNKSIFERKVLQRNSNIENINFAGINISGAGMKSCS